MNIKKLKITVLIVAVLIFAASLTQPAFYTSAQEPNGWANSLGLLLIGWLGTMTGGAGLAWIANPFIIVAWFQVFKKPKTALILSFISSIFALLFLAFDTIMTDEAGNYSTIIDRKAGYWLWLTSIVFFFIGSVVIYFLEKNSPKEIKSPDSWQ